jgi:hypothetical protein
MVFHDKREDRENDANKAANGKQSGQQLQCRL